VELLVDDAALTMLIKNFNGLTSTEAARLVRKAMVDHAITHDDVAEAAKAKYELLNKGGVLFYEPDTAQFSEVGGLKKLKAWLEQRRPLFVGEHRIPGLNIPKGVLLLGVQGSGKSLAAKAVAGTWRVPLLRLDYGALYDKYYGETERKTRESLKMADLMSPCVLWIDEIEKGVATGDGDGGTSRRVLGTLLTWMAERKSAVFLVATANDIKSLPPELMRKGRLDEIFFVDLPDTEIRTEILSIHLKKRGFTPASFDLQVLAEACDGFSGAEIEQAIVSALYSIIGGAGHLDNARLLEEIRTTRPLSVVMAEHINAMREWAKERTVSAN
jgi:SpoVK/Ycf46/Vps4 family AAA+-type ATPase